MRRSSVYRWHALATYNAERARGVVHRPEYDERMRREQEAFDAEEHQRLLDEGWKPHPEMEGVWVK